MDDIDRTSDLAELTTQVAITNQRAKLLVDKESASHCEECGFEIPLQRQIAAPGCTLCIGCAENMESKQKHFR